MNDLRAALIVAPTLAKPTASPRTAPHERPAASLGAMSLGFGKPAEPARHYRVAVLEGSGPVEEVGGNGAERRA
jgi:hypothetical protein